jgi:hypothetical protein
MAFTLDTGIAVTLFTLFGGHWINFPAGFTFIARL